MLGVYNAIKLRGHSNNPCTICTFKVAFLLLFLYNKVIGLRDFDLILCQFEDVHILRE
jgi:hypothetical protein